MNSMESFVNLSSKIKKLSTNYRAKQNQKFFPSMF